MACNTEPGRGGGAAVLFEGQYGIVLCCVVPVLLYYILL